MKKKKNINFFTRTNFDYEEDNYDRLINMEKNNKDFFTNKAKIKKQEYDYEEDSYEPEIKE